MGINDRSGESGELTSEPMLFWGHARGRKNEPNKLNSNMNQTILRKSIPRFANVYYNTT